MIFAYYCFLVTEDAKLFASRLLAYVTSIIGCFFTDMLVRSEVYLKPC